MSDTFEAKVFTLIAAEPNDMDNALRVLGVLLYAAAGVHQGIVGAPYSREQVREMVSRVRHAWEPVEKHCPKEEPK